MAVGLESGCCWRSVGFYRSPTCSGGSSHSTFQPLRRHSLCMSRTYCTYNTPFTSVVTLSYTLILLEISRRTRWWCLKCVIVYLARAIQAFVMYCVKGTSRSSLLIESTDSMKSIDSMIFVSMGSPFGPAWAPRKRATRKRKAG